MTNVLATKPVSEMTPEEKKEEQERINLIQRTVAAGTTRDELLMFLYHAKKTGLDPLARQIYIIVRGKDDKRKATIQASIDGLRLVAERSGNYAGQDAPEFEILDGEMKCTIGVYKFNAKGERYCHSTGVAYKSEYMPAAPNDFMWKTKPHIMLAKVTEALALRKAFPQDLSNVYTEDEMAQADGPIKRSIDPVATEVKPKEIQPATPTSIPSAPSKEAEREETSQPDRPLPATGDDAVLAGDTVDEPFPTEQPKRNRINPIIDAFEKKILATKADTTFKMIEGEINASVMTAEEKAFTKDLVDARRQQLANDALGTT